MTSHSILDIDKFLRIYEQENPGVVRAMVSGASPVPLNLKNLRKVLDLATASQVEEPTAEQMLGLLDRMDPRARARVLSEFFAMPLRDASERLAYLASKIQEWIDDGANGQHRAE